MSDWPERIPGAPVGSERTRPTVPSPAENAATVREALRIGGMTGKQPHAALDALLAQAETAEALQAELGSMEDRAEAAEAELKEAYAKLERTNESFLAAERAAEDSDEEIARLEGALDQAHKDYDETKAERDATEEKNKKLSALIVEQERQYRDGRDAAVREAEGWRDAFLAEQQLAEQAQEALRHINYEWELNDHVPSQHLAAIARAAGELPMGSQTIRALREAREALRHAAKILRVDNYDRGSRITEALAILDAALTGEAYCTCPEGADGNPCAICGKPEAVLTGEGTDG